MTKTQYCKSDENCSLNPSYTLMENDIVENMLLLMQFGVELNV